MMAADIYIFLKEIGDAEKVFFMDYVISKYIGEIPQYSIFLDVTTIKTALIYAGANEDLEEFIDILTYSIQHSIHS